VTDIISRNSASSRGRYDYFLRGPGSAKTSVSRSRIDARSWSAMNSW
jgi:hypothetical protein